MRPPPWNVEIALIISRFRKPHKITIWCTGFAYMYNSQSHFEVSLRSRTRDIDIAILSVRLSVRLSVAFRYRNESTYCQNFSALEALRNALYKLKTYLLTYLLKFLHYTVVVLVLWVSNIFAKFRWGHPMRGSKYRWRINVSWFSTNESLYLANDTR